MAAGARSSLLLSTLCQIALASCQWARCVQLLLVIEVVRARRETNWVGRVVSLLEHILRVERIKALVIQVSRVVMSIIVPEGVRFGPIGARIVCIRLGTGVKRRLNSVLFLAEVAAAAENRAH